MVMMEAHPYSAHNHSEILHPQSDEWLCNSTAPWGWAKASLVVMLSGCSLLTTLGNLLVIAAFCMEKKLRSNFNLFLLNLAITDLLVSLTAMPFYTINYAMCYWPFGEALCWMWIFMDWGMTFASIFTLVAISIDRYWAACWSSHYRNHNSRNRTLISIALIWIVLIIVWVPPFIKDRILYGKPGECIWSIENNQMFSIAVSLLGYHGPSVLILLFYIKVVITMWRLRKKIAKKRAQSLAISNLHKTDIANNSTTDTSAASRVRSNTIISMMKAREIRLEPDPSSEALSSVSGSVTEMSVPGPNIPRMRKKKGVGISRRERKIFASLSCVVIAYLVCWLPWHAVFDLKMIKPSLVSDEWYTFATWMCYMNSAINPILYACANKDFRSAFRRILTFGLWKGKPFKK